MASSTPLEGIDLIDCAKANSTLNVAVAAERCGYGNDIAHFEEQLIQACEDIGIHLQGFHSLNDPSDSPPEELPPEVVITPNTTGLI
jgi:hypothetical protein